jgi:two-component system, NtrC family, sensor kinase
MKLGFRSKIYLGILSLLLLLGIVIFLVVSRTVKEALLQENRNRGLTLGTNLAARVAEPMLAMDFLRMKDLVDETLQSSDDIFYTFVLDVREETLVHTFKGGFPVELKAANAVTGAERHSIKLLDTGNQLVYDYAVPIFIGKDRFGTLRIGLLQTRMRETTNRLLWTTFLSTFFVLAVAGFVGTALARTVTKRVKILHQSSEAAMRGDLSVQTAPSFKKNCWDIMKCGRKDCPAYGQLRVRCWYLAGTLCPCCVEGDYAKKIDSCRECPVYKKCSGDEIQSLAESFDSMGLSLQRLISELRAAEADLSEQRRLLKTILDATPEFVCLQDRDSVYRAANRAFCELAGRAEKEIIGKTDDDLFPPSRAAANRDEDRLILQSGKPLTKEDVIRRNDDERWLHVVKLPVKDANEHVMGLLYSARDITGFKEVQERLIQVQKMEAIGQLTAGIAHEINTPLGIILGYAQLLIEEVTPGSQIHTDLGTVERQAKICKKIVSDLLGFSRRTESVMAPLDVNKTIDNVLSLVEHTFGLNRVLVERRFETGMPAVLGDKEKIQQAVMNLVNNAFDAIGEDGVIAVSTHYEGQNDEVAISVADTGCGIPSHLVDKIFEPFFTTKAGKGTGLGLSVTFGIVKDHGGRIEVQSPLPNDSATRPEAQAGGGTGKGTLFTMYLPVERGSMKTPGGPGNGHDSGA